LAEETIFEKNKADIKSLIKTKSWKSKVLQCLPDPNILFTHNDGILKGIAFPIKTAALLKFFN
jgi:hypothetical protein